jgi:two-component system, NtrC family, sensor histidine kinase KinB
MNRWTFISGLTVTLFLLLLLSGFCVWITRSLTADVDRMIASNFDTLRVLREVGASVARIDGQYRTAGSAAGINRSMNLFELERTQLRRQLDITRHHAGSLDELDLVNRLEAHVQDYLATYEEYFALPRDADERFAPLVQRLAQHTAGIAELSSSLMEANERAILARRDAALAKGRIVTVIAAGFAVFSVSIYVLTSMRLTRAVFEPLRRLRDSIQQVSARRFDELVPIENDEELGQIASSFNQMAAELHRYVSETDERALRASRVSRAILEALPHPVYIVDADFVVHLANPRAEALSAELQIPGAIPGEIRRRIDEAAARGVDAVTDDVRYAVRLSVPAGDDDRDEDATYYLPQIFRMPAAFDGEHGWAVLLVDVTRLRLMDAAKTRALSTLGHEVKTPVAGVRMTLQLLLDERLGPLTAEQRELLEAGRDDCARLLEILQSLLELAQLESGRTQLTLAPHPPSDLLAEARDSHAEAARRAGVELQVEVSDDLPPVLAEAVHAQRVLGNYLTNAFKYGRDGAPIRIVAHERRDGFVRFSVVNRADHMLTEAEQSKVFDPFFRRPGEKAEGNGLGLAITREIANAHGGRVGVYCDAANGTIEFYLDLRTAVAPLPALV